MLLLDDRIGSKELLPLFRGTGVNVECTRLDFGDAAFPGLGPDGDCMIGVERKRISDLIQSMRSRRLSGHQLPGLFDSYAYVYVLVEGITRIGPTGLLEEMKYGKWRNTGIMFKEIDHYLMTLELKTGVMVRRSGDPRESVMQLCSFYTYWQKAWDKHNAHDQLYAPTVEGTRVGYRFTTPTQVQKFAAQLPGIDRKAAEVAKKFKRPRHMMEATVNEWQQIPGIGKVLAQRMVEIFT